MSSTALFPLWCVHMYWHSAHNFVNPQPHKGNEERANIDFPIEWILKRIMFKLWALLQVCVCVGKHVAFIFHWLAPRKILISFIFMESSFDVVLRHADRTHDSFIYLFFSFHLLCAFLLCAEINSNLISISKRNPTAFDMFAAKRLTVGCWFVDNWESFWLRFNSSFAWSADP